MSAPPPNVLVTGSAGHLGCALMYALPGYGYRPIGIDILGGETTTHVGSISDRAFVARVFAENPSIQHVLHTATLHKPHLASHQAEDFVKTNILGTLILLEESCRGRDHVDLPIFVFLSTTSAFGSALAAPPGEPAAWINEVVAPVAKNIYGASKRAAEDLCRLAHLQTRLPVVVLRTSRFFPEEDDDDARRAALPDDNLKVCELAYRRVDVADVVAACVAAMRKAREIKLGLYVISAPPPVARDGGVVRRLNSAAGGEVGKVLEEAVPGCLAVFEAKTWRFLDRVDRVYDSSKAVEELGWAPVYTFQRAVSQVRMGEQWRSELALRVGKRGYHAVSTGVYTIRE